MLSKALDKYNDTVHSSTKMKPKDAHDDKNHVDVRVHLTRREKNSRKYPENTTVVAGATLSGELNGTSDKTKKYDIKDADYDSTEIVKSIKPKTFKLNDETDIGITTKHHIGFIADEIESVAPTGFESIVNENDKGIKMLNCVKLRSVLWGCVREQQQQNIEHLESRLFEVENFIKKIVKPKAKVKSKSKNQDLKSYTHNGQFKQQR